MNNKLATGLRVVLGFFLGAMLNIIVIWAGFLLSALFPFHNRSGEIWLYALIFIGAAQLIWQLPLIVLLRHKDKRAVALGVILAASVTALLNATCWGLLQMGKIRIGG